MDHKKIAKPLSLFLIFCLAVSALGCIGEKETPAPEKTVLS